MNNAVQKKRKKHNDKVPLYCFLKLFYEKKKNFLDIFDLEKIENQFINT